jgi:pilus assembly protein TadC
VDDVSPVVVAAIVVGLLVLALAPPHASRLLGRDSPRGRPPSPPTRTRLVGSAAAGVAVWFAASSSDLLAPVLGVGAAGASYVVLGGLQSAAELRRQARLAAEVPQVCDLLVACLEAGLPIRVAAGVVSSGLDGPMAERLAEVAAKIRLGIAEERAWQELSAEPALAGMGRELARGAGSGTALAGRLRALGLDARREAFAAAEARAKKVGVQTVLPLMLCFLPAFVLLGVLPIVGGLVMRFISP